MKILYTAFDEVPGPKGASTHICEFVRALDHGGADVTLVTPGAIDRAEQPFVGRAKQVVLGCPDGNPLGRVRTFREKLAAWLATREFDVMHCRSPMEGIPLLDPRLRRDARIVYEVNGFPSIELKYHYSRVADDPVLIAKLEHQENDLLAAADVIVTVSDVNRAAIVARGISGERIRVIRNGVDLDLFPHQLPPPLVPDEPVRVCYVGTLTVWQGVDVLIEAVELLRAQRPVKLRLLGPAARGRRQELERLVARLRAEDCVEFLGPSKQEDVVRLLHDSHVTAAPLLPVDRNVRQGCCPLKLLEAMAAGCPIVASDLPVVRELATPEEHLVTVRPHDARHLKNALLRVVETPGLAQALSQAARQHVASHYPWRRANQELLAAYRSVHVGRPFLVATYF